MGYKAFLGVLLKFGELYYLPAVTEGLAVPLLLSYMEGSYNSLNINLYASVHL